MAREEDDLVPIMGGAGGGRCSATQGLLEDGRADAAHSALERDYLEHEAHPATKPLVLAVHALCVTAMVLVLTWFAHFDAGFSWAKGDAAVFNWHPVLMTLGLLVCYAEAAVAYRGLSALQRPTRKIVHGTLHAVALVCVVIGLVAVFRFHNEHAIPNMYSLHSWVGLATVILFFAQYVAGFAAFAMPQMSLEARKAFVPVHSAAGMLILLVLVSATVSMGVLEKLTFGKDCNNAQKEASTKCYVANAFGLTALALAATVAAVLLLPRGGPARRS